MKKFVIVLLAVVLFVGFAAIACEKNGSTVQSAEVNSDISYEEKLDLIEWHDVSELGTLSRDEAFTYDELVDYLADIGFTDEEIHQFAGEAPIQTCDTTESRWAFFKMEEFQYAGGYSVQARFNVELEYVNGSSSPSRILSLEAPTMHAKNCVYDGTIFYRLVSGREFYYSFSGSINDEESVRWSMGATIGIGESASVTATVSGSGWIRNVSDSETYYSAALDK